MAGKWFFSIACAVCASLTIASPTDAADPAINLLRPQGAQRGTEVEVTIRGQRLQDGPFQVLFYDTKQADKLGIEVVKIEPVDDKRVRCTLRLAEDCPLGRYALRLRTASGLSNLLTFHVGNLKEIKEVEPNDTVEQPQKISTDVVVNGVVKEGEVDLYAVELAEGERLSVEIEGLRLGRTLFDPVIELTDETGALLASSDDQPAAHQDAFLTMRAKQAGKVLILVRETAYRGSDASTYRLHVGRFPRPTAVYPPAAMAGQAAELRWLGDTFDETKVTVEVPQTEDRIYEAYAEDEQGISPSGLPLFLGATAPVLEVEPNNNREQANELTAPGIACGVISKPKDKDFFRFSMKKGEEWDFHVRARELRSPLDPVLHVFDPNGKYVKGNDDDRGQPDSYLRYKAPADGEYTVDIEDRQLRGRENMVYVLEISKPAPVVELTLDERRRYRAQVINIPQGGRTAAMITVKRKDYDGQVTVTFDDLPAGAEAEPDYLTRGFHRVPMLFSAKPDAELGAALASVTARRTGQKQPITSRFRQQSWLVRGRNNVHVWSHFADRAAVAVTKALPYSIRIVEPKAPLVQGGSMELKIVAQREEGFENAIAVRTIYNPPGVSTNQSRSIPKKQLEARIPITANGKARTGDWKIAFLGKTSINGEVEASTQLATLRIVEPYFNMKIPSLTVQQGQTTELVVALKQRHPFEGEAELELIRLPPGVTAAKVKVQQKSESAVFQLTIAKDARVGRHRGVGCQARMTVEGEPVRYAQGYVDLCVDPTSLDSPPKKKVEAKTAARENRSPGEAS